MLDRDRYETDLLCTESSVYRLLIGEALLLYWLDFFHMKYVERQSVSKEVYGSYKAREVYTTQLQLRKSPFVCITVRDNYFTVGFEHNYLFLKTAMCFCPLPPSPGYQNYFKIR